VKWELLRSGTPPCMSIPYLPDITPSGQISQAFPLQAIKDWRWEWPGNGLGTRLTCVHRYHILPSKEYCWGLAKVILSLCLHLIDLCTLHCHIYRQGQTETRWKERGKPNCVGAKGGSHKQCCYHKTNEQRYYQEFLPLSSCSAGITG